MKMRKLLSIGALALTITTCTSLSVFAAETSGNRRGAVKQIAINAWKENTIVNNLDININTPVKQYAKQALVDEIINCVNNGIKDAGLKEQVKNIVQDGYNKGLGFKEIFEELVELDRQDNVDITTDESFKAAKESIYTMLTIFEKANKEDKLNSTINKYFNVKALNGTLTYGKNSNNRRVVTLERQGQVVLQISSEEIYELKNSLENNVNSWADLKKYFEIVSNPQA